MYIQSYSFDQCVFVCVCVCMRTVWMRGVFDRVEGNTVFIQPTNNPTTPQRSTYNTHSWNQQYGKSVGGVACV